MAFGRAVRMAERAPVAIGAAFGAEGADGLGQGGAETPEHVRHDRIGADHQGVRLDLAGRVPVADMPGISRELGARHDMAGFRRGPHRHAEPVARKEVAFVQRHGRGKVHQHVATVVEREEPAPQQARLIVERHAGIGDAGPFHRCESHP